MPDRHADTTRTAPDPRSRFDKISPPEQEQPWPGSQRAMTPVPDLGEDSYRGSGKLTDRRALITGADSGIGGAVAIAFAREGADLALAFHPDEQDDADRILALVRDAGRSATPLPGDLTDPGYCRQLVHDAVQALGGLDIVVNVAGRQIAVEDFTDVTDEQFEEVFAVNVFAAFRIVRAALPHLQPGASIINTASLEIFQPMPFLVDYSATKGAIANFSKALAGQLAPKGIRVNVVAPGPTWTALQISGGFPTDKLPQYGQETPLGRAGQPAEIAPAYVYLASDDASFVVGATMSVTGGLPTP